MNAQNLPETTPPTFRTVLGAQMDISPLMCPLTRALMQDPVVFANGVSYERGALLAFLVTNPAYVPAQGPAFVPNTVLRGLIREIFPPAPLADEAPVEESGPIE